MNEHDELRKLVERYARRAADKGLVTKYSSKRRDVQAILRERRRALLALLDEHCACPNREARLTEVGCGTGGNLREMIEMGFTPSHLTGIELLAGRLSEARSSLPEEVTLILGDAATVPLVRHSQDVVYAATVFSSLLDKDFQSLLAAAMWGWVKPGGGVLWYDFTVNNPWNQDVRGVSRQRVKELFPEGRATFRSVTLAPPIARMLCAIHPRLYEFANFAFCRTHVVAWIAKPAEGL